MQKILPFRNQYRKNFRLPVKFSEETAGQTLYLEKSSI